MITIERPNMAINDPRCTTKYQMWNTWFIRADETREHLLNWTAAVASGAPGGKLKNLVIHCHGAPGSMMLGEGFDRGNVGMFSRLAGKVEKIWLHVCSVAQIGVPGGPTDGNLFVGAMAKAAQCYVVAGNLPQSHRRDYTYPPDRLDTYEGLVMSYGPGGDVTWSNRYGDWNSNRE